jgi:hypothetical protein
MEHPEPTLTLTPDSLERAIQRQDDEAPIAGATWYTAQEAGDQLSYRFPRGTLADYAYLTTDLLLDGKQITLRPVWAKPMSRWRCPICAT